MSIFLQLAKRYTVPAASRPGGGLLRLCFDIETDGLQLDAVKVVHCVVVTDLDSDHVTEYGPDQIADALTHLDRAGYLTGHNILNYDLRVLQHLHAWAPPATCKIIDTLVASRLILPNIGDLDGQAMAMGDPTLGKLHGRHSLEAWGVRLEMPKSGVDIEDWSVWTPEIQARCRSDVVINKKVWQFLQPDGYSQLALELEHRCAGICNHISATGAPFDVAAAEVLRQKWETRRAELAAQLQQQFPGTKLTSRKQLGALLEARGWRPEKRTKKTNQPQITDEILETLPALYPEFTGLAEYHILGRRLGSLANGKEAWLNQIGTDGRIHGGLVHIGTPHSRASHSHPNLAQVPNPKKGSPFAAECRSLFRAPEGWMFVAADQANLQDRGFAHYLARFDDGAYAKAFVSGEDQHWKTAAALDLISGSTPRDKQSELHTAIREGAKRFRYAFLYGCGGEKAGQIIYDNVRVVQQHDSTSGLPQKFFGGAERPDSSALKRVGTQALNRFISATPGLRKLREQLEAHARNRGWLPGLDGRRVPVRALHSALNFVVTSSEAIICKRWLVRVYDELNARFQYGWSGDVVLTLWVHDELIACCRPEIAEQVGEILVRNAIEPAEFYKFRVPLSAEFKISKTWAGDLIQATQPAQPIVIPAAASPPDEHICRHCGLNSGGPGHERHGDWLHDKCVDAFILARMSEEGVVNPVPIQAEAALSLPAPPAPPLAPRSDESGFYRQGETQRGAPIAEYIYRTAQGLPHMRVVRTSNKQFPTYRREATGWIKGWPDTLLPYRLPELLAAPADTVIIICEGEKDVETAVRHSFVATSSPGGAGKWQDTFTQYFKGKQRVALMQDNDSAGRKHTSMIAEALKIVVPIIGVVRFAELPEGGDLTDFFDRGGTKQALQVRIDEALKRGIAKPYVLRNLATIPMRRVQWLWPNYLACGHLELQAGEPGLGKSQIQCGYVACVTTPDRPWPDGAAGMLKAGRVLMLTAEDQMEDTTVPRLRAAGADLNMIEELKCVRRNDRDERFLLGSDLAALANILEDYPDIVLVTVDPITAYMGSGRGFDSHRATDVRSQLAPLKDLAGQYMVAISAITHPPKNAGQNPLNMFIGSQAFIAAARIGHLCLPEYEEGTHGGQRQTGLIWFTTPKFTLGDKDDAKTLSYRIETRFIAAQDGGDPIKTSIIDWQGPVDLSASEAIAQAKESRKKHNPVQEFLRGLLGNGPVLQKIVDEKGSVAGFTPPQLRRARKAIGAVTYKRRGENVHSPWLWAMAEDVPSDAATETEDGHA